MLAAVFVNKKIKLSSIFDGHRIQQKDPAREKNLHFSTHTWECASVEEESTHILLKLEPAAKLKVCCRQP
jgi:hypothetical protein